MDHVQLTGELICKNATELALVEEFLPDHLSLTRAEPGCLSFVVEQTQNPLIWRVEECFRSAEAFAAHQERVAVSAWGRATGDIERRYNVVGLGAEGD